MIVHEHMIVGKNITHKFKDKDGDLHIPGEISNSLKNLSKTRDTSEVVGRIRRNEGRYNRNFLPDHIPIIEMYRGKITDNPAICKNDSDKMSFFNTTLDFHTHPKNTDSHLPSEQDCSLFISQKRNAGKTFHAILSNGRMTISNLSETDTDKIQECKNTENICKCLLNKGMTIHEHNKDDDIILKKVFHK